MMKVDDRPKYEQAYQSILARLKAGRYPVGGRMPTESELSTQFRVSRVTIRRALDLLVREGYIESRQGSGYRVIALSPASDTCLTSFTDAMLRAGREPTSRFLSMEVLTPRQADRATLPDNLREKDVTMIRRLREVDGTPQMLVSTFVPTEFMPDARPEDFPESGPGQSMLRILTDRFHLSWSAACEDISPILATAEMAKVLDSLEGAPLLRQSCSAFDDGGATVFFEDVVRSGTVRFRMNTASRSPKPVWTSHDDI